MRWWHGYAVVIAVSLLLALGLALTGCGRRWNSLPLGHWPECDKSQDAYVQAVWWPGWGDCE